MASTDKYAHTHKPIRDLHTPVLLDECLDLLQPAISQPGSILIDATLGMGGHTEAALIRFPNLHVIGIDRDPEAIYLAGKRLAKFGSRFVSVQTTYDHIDEAAQKYGAKSGVDGILMDLGVSSLQLDETERGFSYSNDAPLDMRMNPDKGESAADLLLRADVKELTYLLRTYGEERFANRIAREIVSCRSVKPLTRTGDLVEVIEKSIPAPARRRGGNPSKRTFQALRIAVNNELGILEDAIPRALSSLRVGGRLVVEAYQSLEDRIVKTIFRQGTQTHTLPDLPIREDEEHPPLVSLIRGAGRASEKEIQDNPRSASVRLRAVEICTPWRMQS